MTQRKGACRPTPTPAHPTFPAVTSPECHHLRSTTSADAPACHARRCCAGARWRSALTHDLLPAPPCLVITLCVISLLLSATRPHTVWSDCLQNNSSKDLALVSYLQKKSAASTRSEDLAILSRFYWSQRRRERGMIGISKKLIPNIDHRSRPSAHHRLTNMLRFDKHLKTRIALWANVAALQPNPHQATLISLP